MIDSFETGSMAPASKTLQRIPPLKMNSDEN